jgi:hypothetical protein
MKTYYQMVVGGIKKYFDTPGVIVNSTIYPDKSMITEEVKNAFIEKCTTDIDDHDLNVLDPDCEIKLSVIEIESNEPESYVINVETMNAILDQLNSFMRLMGYGGEYNKIVKICQELKDQGVNLSDYYLPDRVTRS